MHEHLLNELENQGLVTAENRATIRQYESQKPFSLHWELKTLLYLGVLLLNLGLGYLIYDNIDNIGHNAVIAGIAAVCTACFVYASRQRVPFSMGQVQSPSPYHDYVLLLGCLTFLILEGYLQYRYGIFGSRYGLATFIPMVVFFFVAYCFDHRGALSLAITALASWLGIAATPASLFAQNDFANANVVFTGLALGLVLCVVAFASEKYNCKRHFAFMYLNFSIHVLFIACLAGIMILERWLLFVPLLAAAVFFFVWYARSRASLYFLVTAILYAYVGLTYLVFQTELFQTDLIYLYFILSCTGVIVFLLNHKKILGIRADATG